MEKDLYSLAIDLQNRRVCTEEVKDAKYATYYMKKELKEGTYLYEERPKKKTEPYLDGKRPLHIGNRLTKQTCTYGPRPAYMNRDLSPLPPKGPMYTHTET